MMPPLRFPSLSIALLLASFAAPLASAAFSEWKDTQGALFSGEPAEVLGPFALFRTPGPGEASRRVFLQHLSPEDQIRFATTLAAAGSKRSGSSTTAALATELQGGVAVVHEGKLVPADSANRPLPDILAVFYGGSHNGDAWSFHFNFSPTYRRLRAAYGERFDTLLFGVRTDPERHRNFATNQAMPWLVTDFAAQAAMPTLTRFAPASGIRALVLSRSGVPLASSTAASLNEVRRFVDELTDLLFLLDADNPLGWPDRLKYFNTVRPVLHAESDAPPLLLGSPLRMDTLRRRGVTTISARIEVGADGRPTEVTLDPACGVPEALRPAIADGLRRGAYFSPAISRGVPVAGRYDFHRVVPPPPRCTPAELAWINGEARVAKPLVHWLLLSPIPVPERDFSSVERIDENGVNIFTPFEVSDEARTGTQQRNSFDGDWFANEGAGSVQPVAGDRQVVDTLPLTWNAVLAKDGFVEMHQAMGYSNFSIGYAYTEIDAPQQTEAWLAIGSDDGLKLWLNGQLVHSRWIRRNSKLDDEVIPLQLQAGKNRLLLKIQNRTGEWSFVARLRTR